MFAKKRKREILKCLNDFPLDLKNVINSYEPTSFFNVDTISLDEFCEFGCLLNKEDDDRLILNKPIEIPITLKRGEFGENSTKYLPYTIYIRSFYSNNVCEICAQQMENCCPSCQHCQKDCDLIFHSKSVTFEQAMLKTIQIQPNIKPFDLTCDCVDKQAGVLYLRCSDEFKKYFTNSNENLFHARLICPCFEFIYERYFCAVWYLDL